MIANHPPTTLAQALQQAQQQGLARIDAQMLLLHACGRATGDRAWLLAHDTDPLPPEAAARWATLCARRQAGEPVAYLTGRKAFYGLDLAVDARVLDPRPDTETLVDWALEVLQGQAQPRLIDLGTGSGAIALALQHARPDAQVWALDASADALAVAKANAARLGLPVRCLQGQWLAGCTAGPFALIVSNPPYIAAHDPHLAALQHEPLSALVAGADGLDDLRTIVAQAPAHLQPGGWLLLEHGWDQANAVAALLRTAGFAAVHSRNDLGGNARCTGGQWPTVK
ncbi:peptide chain release factor N(5)-glutamine methyltransferase [Acidovorax lacteus]|uniref:Release factor glutamine methyltransferase n=1 Tax=Acidovorax lacteus TaxID=1924988 RepID=A0ABP8L859_9BURK